MAYSELKFSSIPRSAQIYYSVVSTIGFVFLASIVWISLSLKTPPFEILVFAALAILAELYPIATLGEERLGVGFAVYLASILTLGPYYASIIAAISVIPYRIFSRKPLFRTIFSVSEIAIATFCAGFVYQYLRPTSSYYRDFIPHIPALLASLLCFCVIDIMLRGIGAALRETRALTKRWKEGIIPLALFYTALAPLGLILAILYHRQMIGIALFAVSMLVAYVFKLYRGAMGRAKELEERDDVTGLYSRNIFNEKLEFIVERARNKNFPVTLIYLILDNIGEYQDRDKELVFMGIGEVISRCVRGSDIPAREKEGVLVGLPGTPKSGAKVVAEKIRYRIETANLGDSEAIITASIGVATFPDDASDPLELVENSSKAVQQAKEKGNAIVCFERKA